MLNIFDVLLNNLFQNLCFMGFFLESNNIYRRGYFYLKFLLELSLYLIYFVLLLLGCLFEQEYYYCINLYQCIDVFKKEIKVIFLL